MANRVVSMPGYVVLGDPARFVHVALNNHFGMNQFPTPPKQAARLLCTGWQL